MQTNKQSNTKYKLNTGSTLLDSCPITAFVNTLFSFLYFPLAVLYLFKLLTLEKI